MKFSSWARSKLVEAEYEQSLNTITKMFNKIAKTVGDNQELYKAKMQEFQESEQYEKYCYSVVKRMVTPISVINYSTWRKAAKAATKGKFLYRSLMEEIERGNKLIIENQIIENISLIRTLPTDVSDKVVRDIVDEALKGKRARSIEKVIREQTDKHARASARLIARTEVSKTTTALTKARSEQLDIRWYVWRTALDGDRVRKSHRNMEGVLVSWAEPPSPERLVGEKDVGNYHAGNIWNCRCYPEPLLDIDDVTWPHKVYNNGSIKTMGKREFENLM